MVTRLKWMAAAIGITTAFAACATGTVSGGLGGGGGDQIGGSSTGGGSSSSSGTTTTTHTTTTSSSSTSSSGTVNLCGNGKIDPGEQCDGTNLGSGPSDAGADAGGGVSCQSLGFETGIVFCNGNCQLDTTGCMAFPDCTDPTVSCTDPSCSVKPICNDACASPFFATVPGSVSGDNSARPHTVQASCSAASGGPEEIFQVLATQTGRLEVDLTPNGSAKYSVSVRSDCPTVGDAGAPGDGGAGGELGCSNQPSAQSFGDYIVTVPVTVGQTYFVVVQGNTPADVGPFYMYLSYVQPETDCTNMTDDDFNGYVDCDDPNCQTKSTSCVPSVTPTGDSCFENAECTANHHDPICLYSNAFPSGFCSEFCNLAADDCSAGNICYGGLGISTNGVCMHSCTTNSDCRTVDGYVCVDKGLSTKICSVPPEILCNNYYDDDGNGLMDCADPSCQKLPACVPGTTAVGQACALHSDCTASAGTNNPFCIDENDEFYPNGYCSHFCDPAKANDCGPGNACVMNQSVGAYLCMVSCTSSSQCRTSESYSCIGGVCDYF